MASRKTRFPQNTAWVTQIPITILITKKTMFKSRETAKRDRSFSFCGEKKLPVRPIKCILARRLAVSFFLKFAEKKKKGKTEQEEYAPTFHVGHKIKIEEL